MSCEREALQKLRSEILRVFATVPSVSDARSIRDSGLRHWLGIIGWGLGDRQQVDASNPEPTPWAERGGREIERLVARVLEALHDFRCDKALMADVAAEIGRLEQKVEELAARLDDDGRAKDAKQLREECEAFRRDVREVVRDHGKGRRS